MKGLHMIAWILLVIGGLNWLLIGLGVGNVIDKLGTTTAMVIYILVGLSALVEIFTHKKNCRACTTSSMSSPAM